MRCLLNATSRALPTWWLAALCAMPGMMAATEALAAKPGQTAQPPAVAAPAPPVAPQPTAAVASPATPAAPLPVMTMETFLDRLMAAESSGRDDAKNPLSTALGPYQFIEGTWLDIARRHFGTEIQGLDPAHVLALRTDRAWARRAADIYTRENASALKSAGIEPTFPNLRLAFLLGPQGAIRVLQSPADTRVALLLGPSVMRANPFLYGMTAETLSQRAARDLAGQRAVVASAGPGAVTGLSVPPMSTALPKPAAPAAPRILIRCNLDLPACRRWQALQMAAWRSHQARLAAVRKQGQTRTVAVATKNGR